MYSKIGLTYVANAKKAFLGHETKYFIIRLLRGRAFTTILFMSTLSLSLTSNIT